MLRRHFTLVASSISCIAALASNAQAAQAKMEEYSCATGYHAYSICPNEGYCSFGQTEVCHMLCPDATLIHTENDECTTFGSCELVTCTFA